MPSELLRLYQDATTRTRARTEQNSSSNNETKTKKESSEYSPRISIFTFDTKTERCMDSPAKQNAMDGLDGDENIYEITGTCLIHSYST